MLNIEKINNEKDPESLLSAELYRDLFETNQSIILLINPQNGDIINVNKSAIDFYGYSRKKLLSINISHINISSKEKIKEEMDNVNKQEKNQFDFIHKLANGELKNVRVTSSSAKYLNTNVLFSVVVDVTEEYTIKNKLIKKEEELKSFFELSINLQVITDTNGTVIQINNAAKTMLGYEKEELLNQSLLNFLHPNDIDITIKELSKLSRGENVYFFENRAIHKNGTDVNLAWSATVNSTNDLIYATAQNTTVSKLLEIEKNEKEKILIQQSKMATMGEMIANIAHQWKQPLSLISMSNIIFKLNKEDETLSSDEEIRDAIENIDNSVKYLSTTIDDFKNFFIPDKEKVNFKLKNIYEKAYRLLSSQFKNNEIEFIVELGDIEMYGFPNEILQVLINIINNARDELIKDTTSSRKLIFINAYQEKGMNVIKIKDNAGGIPIDIIDKIYEPYFTTKSDNKGTGIGLYMSKQIIKNMNGTIDASNVDYIYEKKRYNGAEFTFKLIQKSNVS